MYRIIVYRHYYEKFIRKLSADERRKFMDILLMFSVEEKILAHCIKYLREGIYEFRVTFRGKELRLFFIYDGNAKIALLNGFVKKSQKTPEREIRQAIKLKEAYYAEKKERTVVL